MLPYPTTTTSASLIVTSVASIASWIAPSTIAGRRSSISSRSGSYSWSVDAGRRRGVPDLRRGPAEERVRRRAASAESTYSSATIGSLACGAYMAEPTPSGIGKNR